MAPATPRARAFACLRADQQQVIRPATARALDADQAVDVRRVLRRPRLLDLGARTASSSRPGCSTSSSVVGVLLDVRDRPFGSFLVGRSWMVRCRGCGRRRRRCRVCTCSFGWLNSSPLRRSRTVPLTSVSVQVWQMPIRQPWGMPTPAPRRPGDRRRAVDLDGLAGGAEGDRPALAAVAAEVEENRSKCSSLSRPARSKCSVMPSSIGAGPHA